jgi:hypothetical protein
MELKMKQRSTSEIVAAVRIAAASRKYNAAHQPLSVDDITDDQMNAIGMQAVENGFYAQTFITAEDVIHFLDNGDNE